MSEAKAVPVRTMWREAAAPAWGKVPDRAKALFDRVCREAAGIQAGFGGFMAWPESSLKEEFAAVESPLLAGACLAMSRYGLWHPDRSFAERGAGGWHKFTAYCDQTLRVRFGLPEGEARYEDQWGMGLSVLDGLARVEFDLRERHGWYVYLGLATENHVRAAREAAWPRYPGRDDHPLDRGRWVQRCREVADGLAAAMRPAKGAVALLFDCGAVPGHGAKCNSSPGRAENGPEKGAAGGAGEAGGRQRVLPGAGD